MPALSLGTGVGFRGRVRRAGGSPAEPPALLAAPRLLGSGRIGAPLAVDPGVWRGTPAPTLGRQWLRDGAAIAGATGATYLPAAEDDLLALACAIAAVNPAGTAAAVTPPVVVTHVPPVLAQPLPDVALVQNTGTHSMTLSTAFTGLALSFSVTGNGVSIDPGTGEIRILTDALQDGLEVAVTASNSGGDAVGSFRLTVRAAEPPATPPVLVTPPSLAGSGTIGSPLTVDPGSWDGRPAPELALQWRRDGADIAGAVEASYLPSAADDRAELGCAVTARNAAGELEAVAGPVRAAFPAPETTGTLPDLVLEAGTGTRIVDAAAAFAGQALTFAVSGAGASVDPLTGVVSIPTDAEVAEAPVTVTASNSGGSATTGFRLTVRAAEPPATPPVLVTPPSLAGSGTIGSPLTVDPGSWDGRPAPELALQWRRDGADIAGAVEASYLPSAADDRAELGCAVTARNAAGELEAVAGPVRAAFPAPETTGTLPDLVLEAGTGTRIVDAAAAFAGQALTFAVSGAGASVDPLTGVVSIPTDAEVAEALVTVTASNSGGSATTGFRVTVAAVLAAPEAVGGIPDQVLEQGSGPWTVSAQAAFRGEALGFALDAAPAGVGIDAGSGLVTIATDALVAAAPVTVRASNAAGAATQGFAVTVRSTVTAFEEAGRLGELGFIFDVAPSWSQEAGFARLVPAVTGNVHGDWSKALGDGRYRCLARWGGATTPPTVLRPFWLNARFRRADGNAFGVRADLFEGAGGQRVLELRQYTGAGTATAAIAPVAVVGWAWDAWQWVELEIDGKTVRARVYPEAAAAPDWQIAGTTDQTAAGAFGPGGQPRSGGSPMIDLRRLEVHPLSVQIPAIPAAPLDTDWDIAQFTERT